jgi:hypothetical protein
MSFPAVAEDDETHAIETLPGPHIFRRAAGQALDPAREPLEILERIRATIGESISPPSTSSGPHPSAAAW